MKHHLVIGGAGFIGCNLVAHLLKNGNNVTVFDNLSRKGALNNIRWLIKNNSTGLDIIQGDISTDNYKLLEAVKKAEVVYHLASQVAMTTSVINPREDFEINALGTLNVLEAIRGVGDLIRAFELATEKIEVAQGQIYNIGGGPRNTLSLLELVDFLENITGKKMQYTFSDWRPGDQRVYISDIRKVKKDLDWTPKVAIPEGLKILYEWVKENKDVLLHLMGKQTSVKSTLFYSAMSKNFKRVAKTQPLKEVKNFPVFH